ncbi:MAG: hypothetical protein RL311_145 [Bacteroidota bacterium]|jgi:hypothetical protein
MRPKQLLALGFINTSYIDDEEIEYTQFDLKTENFNIQVSGVNFVKMKLPYVDWFTVPNCKTILDVECLIKLFS